jgi:hypothetical protein
LGRCVTSRWHFPFFDCRLNERLLDAPRAAASFAGFVRRTRDPSTFARICQAGDVTKAHGPVVAASWTVKARGMPMQAEEASASVHRTKTPKPHLKLIEKRLQDLIDEREKRR